MEILRFKELDSTSSEAERRYDGLDNWTVISAGRQNSGRGQGNHVWFSSDSSNLTFTIVLKFREGILKSDAAVDLMNSVSEGVCDYLRSKGVCPSVKYPNDIIVADRKICGVLIKTFLMGKIVTGAIVGVGLDLNETSFPEELEQIAISLKQLTGKTYDCDLELELLLESIGIQLGHFR